MSTFTVAPVNATVPAPVTFEPALRLCVPPANASVAPVATLKLPVLLVEPKLFNCSVPRFAPTLTVPLLFITTQPGAPPLSLPRNAVPVPAVFAIVPVLVSVVTPDPQHCTSPQFRSPAMLKAPALVNAPLPFTSTPPAVQSSVPLFTSVRSAKNFVPPLSCQFAVFAMVSVPAPTSWPPVHAPPVLIVKSPEPPSVPPERLNVVVVCAPALKFTVPAEIAVVAGL